MTKFSSLLELFLFKDVLFNLRTFFLLFVCPRFCPHFCPHLF
nr:MAG TPA: hypothetical protein [Bacteriophage sp.]